MSATEPNPTPQPTRRLRGVLYATVLLAGGGIIGALVAGPMLDQVHAQGGQSGQAYDQDRGPDRGPGPDGPQWRQRFMDRQQSDDGGPGWRRGFWRHRFGMQEDDDRPGMRGRLGFGMARMMYPGAIERRVNRVLGIVDASTEQKQKVRAIFEKAANDVYGSRDKRVENRRATAEALAAATIDHAKVEQLRQDRMKLADATSKRMTDALVEAAEVLTPAQRADLAARIERRRGN